MDILPGIELKIAITILMGVLKFFYGNGARADFLGKKIASAVFKCLSYITLSGCYQFLCCSPVFYK